MRTAQLGVLASLGIGVFVANGQGSGWEIKRQPWGPSTQKWSESAQWSEQWTWTADQQLPAAPGSAWQFSQSSTIAPPLPLGASSGGKWTWIPSPSSQGGFFWSYSSSSSPPSSSQGLGTAPGTPWQFSQSNTTPPPLPAAGQSVGSWKWISGPSGGYYWSFIPGPKQDLPTPPGTAWQFSQSSTVAPPLPAGATSGSWKWISAPSGAGYYWSFIAGPKQNLPPPPGTEWIFSTSSTTAPPLPAGVSGAGTWKWVSSPDGKGYCWSFISSGGQTTPQQKLPDPPTGGSGWIFSTSSTVPPALPAGVSGAGSWKWVSSPDGKGYYWSYISSPGTQVPVQKLPELPTGGSGWIFSTSSTTPPPLPAGVSGAGSWKWVSSPDGNGYYWSYISSPGTQVPAQKLPEPPTGGSGWIFSTSSTVPPALPAGVSGTVSWQWVSSPDGKGYYWSFIPSPQSPQQQLPQPSSGSTEWIFSPSKTTPSLPPGISGTAGSWRWVSSPSGEGYYWSFTPSYQPTQQLPTPKPGSSGWIFSGSKTEPPKISGITGPGSWTWISNGSGQGYYWTWTPGAPQGVPSGFQGGVVTPGSGGSGSIKGPFEGSIDQTGKPIDTTGGNIPSEIPGHLSTGDQPGTKPGDQPFEGSFDQTGKLVEQGGSTSGSHSTGAVPVQQPGTTGELPTHEIPQTDGTGFIPGSGDAGVIKGPFEGSFDHTGKPVDIQPIQGGGSTEGSHSGGGVPVQQPGTTGEAPLNTGTGGTGSVPGPGDAGFLKGPFGNLFDHTGKPVDTQPIQGGGSTEGSHSSGGVPVQQPGTTGETPLNSGTGGTGSVPGPGDADFLKGPFGNLFDLTGKPVDTQPIQGGGSTEGSHSSGGVPVQQPGTTGETPVNPQTSGEGSVLSSGSEDDIVRGPFEGFFDKTGKPLDSGSQGTYKCPPRSRIELLDAPTVPEAVCPNSQDRRYSAGGKDFYILCCRHVDGGKKEIAVIPNIPSLQYCIHICAGTANCKSVLYTARQGYKSNYPLKSCQLFEHGNYGIQTPCNNDAHDSAYLIEPPTGTTGDIPPPPIAVDPPISPPPQVDIPPSFIMLPPGISEQCAQNVLAAIKCGTCASC